MNMIRRNKVVAYVGILCFVTLAGCSDNEKQQARARAEAAEAKLKEVEAQQQATQRESDTLKTEVGALSKSLQDPKSQLSSAAKLKDQVSNLMVERDAAIGKLTTAQATIDGMKSQFQEQLQKFSLLEEQNKELQAIVNELRKKLGGEIKLPAIPKLK